jgi:hypothetical protein
MPGPWWEWAVCLLLSGTLAVVLVAAVWIMRDDLRALPERLTAWLEGVAARLEPKPPECSCRAGGELVAIRSWELGDTLETGATGPVIDQRCPTCWLPRAPRPAMRDPFTGALIDAMTAPVKRRSPQRRPDSLNAALQEFDALASLITPSEQNVARLEYLADYVERERNQPPATGGVRFGGDRQALYWVAGDHNADTRVYARLLDGTTRTFPSMEEAKAWILSTRSPERRTTTEC